MTVISKSPYSLHDIQTLISLRISEVIWRRRLYPPDRILRLWEYVGAERNTIQPNMCQKLIYRRSITVAEVIQSQKELDKWQYVSCLYFLPVSNKTVAMISLHWLHHIFTKNGYYIINLYIIQNYTYRAIWQIFFQAFSYFISWVIS